MEVNYRLLSENANIMIVDDTPANLALLAKMLKDCGYQVRPVPNGRLALQAAKNDPPDLILLDITMPEIDGYEVCRRLKADADLKEIPVLFISALSQTSEKVKAFEVGGLDYVTKPFQFKEVKARIETHLKLFQLQKDLEKQVQRQIKDISDSQMSMIFALAKLAETRDTDTGRHLERVQVFCKLLASNICNQHDLSCIDDAYIERIYRSSPLHDIGKVGIPDAILLKPGKLDAAEFEIMKTHSALGAQTLEAVKSRYPENAFIGMGISIARHHHEKWDGKGYPDGLSGEAIPLSARIMSIADVYDALRSKRAYKQPFSPEEACDIIIKDSGKAFDPALIEVFTNLKDEFGRIWNEHSD